MILRPPSVFTTGEMCACTARIAFTKALSDDVAVAKCAAVTRAGGPVIFSGIPTPRWGLPYSTQIGGPSLILDRKDPSNIVQEYCYEIAVWMFYLVGGFMRQGGWGAVSTSRFASSDR